MVTSTIPYASESYIMSEKTLFNRNALQSEAAHKPSNQIFNVADTWSFCEQLFDVKQEHIFTAIGPQGIKMLYGLLDDLYPQLQFLNNNGYSIFTPINEIEGLERKDQYVTRVVALFADLDGAPLDPVLSCVRTPPHLIVETSPGRWHAYWLVQDCPLERFKPLQKAIAKKFTSDTSICDLARLMRVPGFKHYKKGKSNGEFTTRLVSANESPPYSIDQVINELALNVSQTTSRQDRFTKFDPLDTVPEGGRHTALTKFAGSLIGRGYEPDNALDQLCAWNDAMCTPPLDQDEIVNTYYSILRADQDKHEVLHPVIEAFNADNTMVRIAGKTRILTETSNGIEYSTVNDFRNYYSNRPKVDGQTAANFWLNHAARRTCKEVVFSPGQELPIDVYNLWRGLAVESSAGNCKLYLNLVKEVICSGSADYFNYLINFMAHAVQKPGEIPGVAIVLVGGRGTGKGVTVSTFGALFGKHFAHLTSAESFLGQFNSHLADKIVLFADEVFWSGDKKSEGKLKTLITEARKQVEAKGLPIIEMGNYTRLFMATNDDWAVPAGADERRFFVLQVNNKWQQDAQYFSPIIEQLKNGGLEALLHHLQNIDISAFNPRIVPVTNALVEQKLRSLTPIQRWWYQCCFRGHIGFTDAEGRFLGDLRTSDTNINQWPTFASTEALHGNYCDYCKNSGHRYPETNGIFISSLRKIATLRGHRSSLHGRRISGQLMPTIAEARQQFTAFIGQPVTWED